MCVFFVKNKEKTLRKGIKTTTHFIYSTRRKEVRNTKHFFSCYKKVSVFCCHYFCSILWKSFPSFFHAIQIHRNQQTKKISSHKHGGKVKLHPVSLFPLLLELWMLGASARVSFCYFVIAIISNILCTHMEFIVCAVSAHFCCYIIVW